MSERTTIGGTVYESIGSSSSNLLLKCNGTARIQWGSKLIDLIKNGKIASGDSSSQVSVISDISEIKSDGVYVLNKEKSLQLWVCKNGEQYNLTGVDLYISASTKQDITAEQRKQALENIGMYYNTLDDVRSANITNGLVYVLEDSTLYTIKEGIISEFEAKLKTVTVETNNEHGEIINSAIKIVLSILDEEYISLENDQITISKPVHIKEYVQFGSEGADAYHGYRFFFNGDSSQLDVDKINVRLGIPTHEYIEITYSDLYFKFTSGSLEPHKWYLITDFQNHWKLFANDTKYNRPILVRALTNASFYKEGQLFKDRRVIIHYDITYNETIKYTAESESSISAKGRITWMKDSNNNEANFDFLDYSDFEGNPLSTLHDSIEDSTLDSSIFPKYSYNNKLTVYDLKGITVKNQILETVNVNTVDFQFPDTKNPEEIVEGEILPTMIMHNNTITCRGLTLTPNCTEFYSNVLTEISNVVIDSSVFSNNIIAQIYTTIPTISSIESFVDVVDNTIFTPTQFTYSLKNVNSQGIINSIISNSIVKSTFGIINNSTINGFITNSTFDDIADCTFDSRMIKVQFKSLLNCVLSLGSLENVTCRSDISNYIISQETDPILYDVNKIKDVYFSNGQLSIVSDLDRSFKRGMIIMHSGITAIPEGWAICDGNEYTYNGITSRTPNLINRFIKAVGTVSDISTVNNPDLNSANEFNLDERHLPSHSHPHKAHSHSFAGSDSDTVSITINAVNSATEKQAIVTMEGGISGHSGDDVSSSNISASDTVYISISGTTSAVSSMENTKTWANESFKIEPNYYSLIFIMKL